MTEYVYRFRSIENLLGNKELENQSIYFSPPTDLNDPIENFKDIVWNGDNTLWSNLFRNYLICLYSVFLHIRNVGEVFPFKPENIPVFSNYERLPTDHYKENITNLFQTFFSNINIQNLIKGLSLRENVRRSELLYFLECIHLFCVQLIKNQHITEESTRNNSIDPSSLLKEEQFCPVFFEFINKLKDSTDYEKPEESYFSILLQAIQQTKTLTSLEMPRSKNNKKIFCMDFPKLYIRQIEELLFWPWYAACFSKTPTNSSMWGYYAEGHKGICLKFKTCKENDKKGIYLRTITCVSWSKNSGTKNVYGNRFFPLYDINYEAKLEPISFFKSIGRLSLPALISHWFSDDAKNVSPLVQDILNSRNEWHKNYWKTFFDNIPIKTYEWKHEEESRLIHHSILSNTIPKEERILRYSFKDLDGIIFGINTTEENKIEIIRIINELCISENRNDFNFYQASHNSLTSKIDIRPLYSLIKNQTL
jgi:hypothetical protein